MSSCIQPGCLSFEELEPIGLRKVPARPQLPGKLEIRLRIVICRVAAGDQFFSESERLLCVGRKSEHGQRLVGGAAHVHKVRQERREVVAMRIRLEMQLTEMTAPQAETIACSRRWSG